ncbi:MAG: AAA family ATPase [Pseudomonadales bacterium]|nr:AAA family ATPase [Pseudomonadales bacterium]
MTDKQSYTLADLELEPYIISEIDIFNWGPFSGRHQIKIDAKGTAIIGPTGSGKTTLIDALMTLLVERPRYNLASSGGHESDRSLMSYVRGELGGDVDSTTSSSNSAVRRSKTTTGISATLTNGHNQIRLGAVIWIDSTSFANADRRDLWIFSQNNDLTLDDWLEAHSERGKKGMTQLSRNTRGLDVFEAKKAYLAQTRRFFEVGTNAFVLLNRAAGLKQLNNIDEIFRELVLDDHSKFDRALEVAKDFDDLTEIYEELQTARRQQASLQPLEALNGSLTSSTGQLSSLEQLEEILPRWFASKGIELWSSIETEILADQEKTQEALDALSIKLTNTKQQADDYRALYLRKGGGAIEELNSHLKDVQKLLDRCEEDARHYNLFAKNMGLDPVNDKASFELNQKTLTSKKAELEPDRDQTQQALDTTRAKLASIDLEQSALLEEIKIANERPDSNIPADYQKFRQDLASALALPERSLPFIAELLSVKEEESSWRGAIERAIGGHRLRLLIADTHLKNAIRWINSRHNKLHVRVMNAERQSEPAVFKTDGFSRKLEFKKHEHREAVKHHLAQIDLHCVETTDKLQNTPFAMTIEGTMSGRKGYFDKQDQKHLSSGWVTGFNNKDLLASLEAQHKELDSQRKSLTKEREDLESQLKEFETAISQISLLLDVSFEKIDTSEQLATIRDLEEKRDRLLSSHSGAREAMQKHEELLAVLDKIEQKRAELIESSGSLSTKLQQAVTELADCKARLTEPLAEDETELAESRFSIPENAADLALLERQLARDLKKQLTQCLDTIKEIELKIVSQMGTAQHADRGELVDASTEVVDIGLYLDRLKVLNEEALPEKLQRFLTYLNQASDQGVNQLIAEIDEEVNRIEERIDALNQTLKRVDFQENQHLQLAPSRVRNDSLRELEHAMKRLRSAKLAVTDDQGETHYKSLEEIVNILRDAGHNRTQVRSRALLDPRHRLQFAFKVIDRRTGDVVTTRESSKGDSGGEKEIIASYILTASLSYALCPGDSPFPLFGTVVLDEAFSKSSQAVAARIIAALKIFELHAIFVTPNKELQLLRDHTNSAIVVHRKDTQSTCSEVTWQEIDEIVKRK